MEQDGEIRTIIVARPGSVLHNSMIAGDRNGAGVSCSLTKLAVIHTQAVEFGTTARRDSRQRRAPNLPVATSRGKL